MWPYLTGRDGRSKSQDSEDRFGGPPAVTTKICTADGLTLAQGALGVKYMPLALVSEISVFKGGRVGVGMVGI